MLKKLTFKSFVLFGTHTFAVTFKEIPRCSSFVKSFDMLPTQKSY